jgi:hypothetical protein
MADIVIRLDAAKLIAWSGDAQKLIRQNARNAVNRVARVARREFAREDAADTGTSQARVKKGIGPLIPASPATLTAKFTAKKLNIGIMATSGATLSKGLGLRASTFRYSGGRSASLNIPKAFLIYANGGRFVATNPSHKHRGKLHGIYAEMPSTALGQDRAAPRMVWQREVDKRLKPELSLALRAALTGASSPTDSGGD